MPYIIILKIINRRLLWRQIRIENFTQNTLRISSCLVLFAKLGYNVVSAIEKQAARSDICFSCEYGIDKWS